MTRIVYILLILFWSQVGLFGQTKAQFVDAAEKAFSDKNYYAALVYFNEVLDFDKNDTNALLKSAQAAQEFNSYQLAIQRYEYLLDTLEYDEDKSIYFRLGELYQRIGEYEKSGDYYDMYLSQYSDDNDYFTQKARVEKVAVDWARLKSSEPDPNVVISRLESEVNSNDSDFGPMVKDSNLVFSSMRFKETKSKYKPPRQISKIMQDKDGVVGVLDEKLNDTDLSLGNTALASDNKTIYFTKCEYVEPQKLRCDLYKGVLNENDMMEEIVILPNIINDTTYTTTQPSIGKLTGDEREVLFFSSDRIGGKGKLDIWYSFINADGSYESPVNLAAINTSEDEITPFFHNETKNIFFSSNGKQGFGGYDIYQAVFVGDSIADIFHLDAPTNSSYHDIYYTLSPDQRKAYFSTNREGALYVDEYLKSCCFDIFEANITPVDIKLRALTYDKNTALDLIGARVTLLDMTTGEVIAVIANDTSNVFLFPLEKGKQYMVKAEKLGYKPDSVSFTTFDIKESGEIVKKLFLEPDIIKLDVFTFDDDTKLALEGATVILENLTDPVKPQELKFNELSNDFHFLVERGKTYRITAKRDGYTTTSDMIDTRGLDNTIKKDLFLKPLNLAAYIPLALYFDNDEPDPDKKTTETNKRYNDLYNNYYKRRNTFASRNGSRTETIEFFENDVKGGHDKLQKFMEGLLKELEAGQQIEITMKGFASPRYDVKYNLVLAQRRVMSIINEMKRYGGGKLGSYINSNRLIINQISYGEELSPSEIDDRLRNEKGSIYSIGASRERKVEVISIKAKL